MLLVDVNLLVYSAHRNAPQHEPAKAWLERNLDGHPQTLAFTWPCILGFLRLVSSSRVFPRPISVQTAWEQVERWLDAPAAWVPIPGPRHRFVLGHLIESTRPGSPSVPDLHLAALAIENGLTVASADNDFGRIPGLRWFNPLAQR